jgi:membrane protein implicated in regulation of membrane protease activity
MNRRSSKGRRKQQPGNLNWVEHLVEFGLLAIAIAASVLLALRYLVNKGVLYFSGYTLLSEEALPLLNLRLAFVILCSIFLYLLYRQLLFQRRLRQVNEKIESSVKKLKKLSDIVSSQSSERTKLEKLKKITDRSVDPRAVTASRPINKRTDKPKRDDQPGMKSSSAAEGERADDRKSVRAFRQDYEP